MPYEFGTHTGTNNFIERLKIFAEANGWTVNFFGLYSGNNRLHLSKSGQYVAIWYATTSSANFRGHTSYAAGSNPDAQPGVSPAGLHSYIQGLTSGYSYAFFAFGDSLYYYLENPANPTRNIGGFGSLTNKIGAWSGGNFIWCNSGGYQMFTTAGSQACTIYINGAWTPMGTDFIASGLLGSVSDIDYALQGKMPNAYNAQIVMLPIVLMQRNSVTASLLHPLGFVSDVCRFNAGNVYVDKEIITRGGDNWMAIRRSGLTDPPTLLFRVA